MKKVVFLFVLCYTTISSYAQVVEQDVSVLTPDGVTLYGSLVLPSLEQQNFPVAIIIAGSGPTDRNGNNVMMLNNSLKMVADSLATYGIASIRYDKRGIGQSQVFNLNESELTIQTFADDARCWVNFAHGDNSLGDITLIGHSEGAKLSLMVAASDTLVDKLVLLAGEGRSTDAIIKEQLAEQPPLVRDAAYTIIDSLRVGKRVAGVPSFLSSLFRPSVQNFLMSNFMVKPTDLISKINIPILIIQGSTDIQISVRDAMQLSASNHEAELVIIDDMNHILKSCNTKEINTQMSIYSNPTIGLHPKLIPNVSSFILQ